MLGSVSAFRPPARKYDLLIRSPHAALWSHHSFFCVFFFFSFFCVFFFFLRIRLSPAVVLGFPFFFRSLFSLFSRSSERQRSVTTSGSSSSESLTFFSFVFFFIEVFLGDILPPSHRVKVPDPQFSGPPGSASVISFHILFFPSVSREVPFPLSGRSAPPGSGGILMPLSFLVMNVPLGSPGHFRATGLRGCPFPPFFLISLRQSDLSGLDKLAITFCSLRYITLLFRVFLSYPLHQHVLVYRGGLSSGFFFFFAFFLQFVPGFCFKDTLPLIVNAHSVEHTPFCPPDFHASFPRTFTRRAPLAREILDLP